VALPRPASRLGTQEIERLIQSIMRRDMSTLQSKSGFVSIDNAKIHYESAGTGMPLVMIHAGVADSRQWNNEFAFFFPESPGHSI
jgi:hypothetical protein